MASLLRPPFAVPTCYATVSIGTSKDPLGNKLEAIAAAGFKGVELGFPDLLSFASNMYHRDVQAQDFNDLCAAGKDVKALCEKLDLKVVMLQPFANFEGWEPHSEERQDAFRRAKGWIRIMEAVGTDMLQVWEWRTLLRVLLTVSQSMKVGSTDSPNVSSSQDVLAADLRELADLLASKGYRLAYENWCWATYAPTWKEVWQIVQKVDRNNVGLCLDTFQTAGGEWADPTTKTGFIEGEGGREVLEQKFHSSLAELQATIPAQKIYILQISDAYKPETPLDPSPDQSGLRPRGRWSASLRPLPFDGGYLPVVCVAQAVLQTGFRGWFSTEIFDGGPRGEGKDWSDLNGFAMKAMNAHLRLLQVVAENSST